MDARLAPWAMVTAVETLLQDAGLPVAGSKDHFVVLVHDQGGISVYWTDPVDRPEMFARIIPLLVDKYIVTPDILGGFGPLVLILRARAARA